MEHGAWGKKPDGLIIELVKQSTVYRSPFTLYRLRLVPFLPFDESTNLRMVLRDAL
jgi:hypothetical protein